MSQLKTGETIADKIHERSTLITAVINKKQAMNRTKFSSDKWRAEYWELDKLSTTELKALNKPQ